jgi:hypothetical protein
MLRATERPQAYDEQEGSVADEVWRPTLLIVYLMGIGLFKAPS